MDDFFSYMYSDNSNKGAAEKFATDEKPEIKKEVECGLCMTEKDKKSGECKFDKGASAPVRDALGTLLEVDEDEETELPDGEEDDEEAIMVGEDKKPDQKKLKKFLEGSGKDAAPGDWDEEKHPRNKKGEKDGGKFKTSNKTIEKQDEIGDGKDLDFLELSNSVNNIVKGAVKDIQNSAADKSDAVHTWIATGSVGGPGDYNSMTATLGISGYCGTKEQFDKKEAAAKSSAEKAVKFLTEKTGRKWKIDTKEIYDKDDNLLKGSSDWRDSHDITYVLIGED